MNKTAKNADMPAMPVSITDNQEVQAPYYAHSASGLTKREMMAMHICAEIAGSIDSEECYQRIKLMASNCGLNVSQWIARDAAKQADALLEELERTK